MDIEVYIDRVINTKKNIFCDVTFAENFSKCNLLKLCNLNISRKRLNIAWSMILDVINDCSLEQYLLPEVLDFLIENDICLMDLGHLKIPKKYLEIIYNKNKNCWEALENIKRIDSNN